MGGESLRVWLLGTFRVAAGERALGAADFRLRASQQIIKLLALAPDHRLHREQVLDALWPDQAPRAAANSLNQTLFVTRRALAAPGAARTPFLTLRDQTLSLGPADRVWVDATAFADAARAARQAEDVPAAIAALDLYQGDLLPDDPYEPWLDVRRATLRQHFRTLALSLAAWAERAPDVARAVEALQLALAGDPADEALHRALMRLYAIAGDRTSAIAQYELLARAVRHDLDVAPEPQTQQLQREILSGQLAPAAGEQPAPANGGLLRPPALPLALTSFVGRDAELAELHRLLTAARLLTIAGAGGSGKTRLALEVVRAEQPSFPDGVAFVELAALGDPALLALEVARGLGLRETQGVSAEQLLIDAIGGRRLLLALDNCEHLVGACAALAEQLLRRCPELRVLTTSREPLRIGGEVTWRIPALALPAPGDAAPSAAEVSRYPALQLFLDRATATRSSFELRDADVPALLQICARLDGMPLAIELAAARVAALGLEQIAERLGDRFRLLQGGSRTALPRQQTLRAAIDWSYDLLDDRERTLLGRLGVFSGGWTLEAAEHVCAGDGIGSGDVLPLIEALAQKSLVAARDAGGARRYALLETVRSYALERLRDAGAADALRSLHQQWCLQLTARGEAELTGPRQAEWLGRLAAELDNLRAAIQWEAVPGDLTGLQIAFRLYWFWYLHSAVGEGRAVFERALARVGAGASWARGAALIGAGAMALYQGDLRTARARLDASLPVVRGGDDLFSRALAPFMAGTVAVNQGDYPAAAELLADCLPLFEQLGHRQGVATALLHQGDVALGQGDAAAAEARYRSALAIHRAETGSAWGMAQALNNLGEVARYQGDLAAARRCYEDALERFRQLATKADVARTLHNLAALALAEGDIAAARDGYAESLALFRSWGNCRGIVECVAGLASLHIEGDPPAAELEAAAALLAFAEAYFASAGSVMWPPDRRELACAWAGLERRLSAETLAACGELGRSLRLDEAVEAALGRSPLR